MLVSQCRNSHLPAVPGSRLSRPHSLLPLRDGRCWTASTLPSQAQPKLQAPMIDAITRSR
jgi:hypothetical protein